MKMNVMNPALHLKHVTHSLRKVQWKISTKYRSALLCSAGREAVTEAEVQCSVQETGAGETRSNEKRREREER